MNQNKALMEDEIQHIEDSRFKAIMQRDLNMVLYMKVTNDKYQLPVAVSDSVKELARMVNTTPNVVLASISRQRAGKQKGTYYRVEVDDSESDS